jgi:general secretion pathway protein D
MPRLLSLLFLSLALFGCAAQRAYDEGIALIESGHIEAGLAKVDEAARQEPGEHRYRLSYVRQRELAVQRLLAQADTARARGDAKEADNLYKRVQALDPGNARAAAALGALSNADAHRTQLAEAETLFRKGEPLAAHERVRRILAENPQHKEARELLRKIEQAGARQAAQPALSPALRKAISLSFREATLRQVFELLTNASGINIILDRDVRPDQRTTIYVRDTPIEDALRFVLVTNQLDRKVLNENSILVYPNTPAKQREYQDLVVKSFYLTNADVKLTANMIRQLVKSKDVFIDEKLNLLVMRDTPDAVRMAERLIATQDLAEPEVMLEVEVLEVGSSVLTELGIRYPDQISFSLIGADGIPGTITLREWQNRSSELVRMSITNPALVFNLRSQAGRSNVLANPRIRVKNREKARIHIGDKVPVITTTTTATGFASESVGYLDVGLKLDVEPNIYLDEDVAMKVGLEVSSILQEVRSNSGALTYRIGTRNTATTLRLKDGETQVLAGLISDEDRKNVTKVPGLGDVPVLGRLFSNHADTGNRTEIVLLITPRVLRTLARPEAQLGEFLSGTEASIGAPPLQLQPVSSQLRSEAPAAPLASVIPAAPPSSASVALQAPAKVAIAQEFALRVQLAGGPPMRSVSFDVAFDPGRLRVLRIEEGAAARGKTGQSGFTYQVNESAGRVSVSLAAQAAVFEAGELALIVLQSRSDAPGQSQVVVDRLTLLDAGGSSVGAVLPAPAQFEISR